MGRIARSVPVIYGEDWGVCEICANGMIEVSCFKDGNAAELFLGFRIGGHRWSRLCRFSSTGSARSPEAEEPFRQQDVRWRANGRCARSIHQTRRFARPRSYLRIFPAQFPLPVGSQQHRRQIFSITVSSNEAQRILI